MAYSMTTTLTILQSAADSETRYLFSIFNKTPLNETEVREIPKKLHLLDDSELEDSSHRLSDTSCVDLPSPSSNLPSQSTADNCTLLTR